jgi:PAS domain S-box-containing protein
MHDALFNDATGDLAGPRDEAYAVVDADGVVIGWSSGAQRLLGYAAEEIQGWHGTDLLHTRAEAARLAERRPPGEAAWLGKAVLRHRDGGRVEVALRAQRLETTSGEQQWLVRAEGADAERRHEIGDALLRGLFSESPFIIDVFDNQLRLVAQNA